MNSDLQAYNNTQSDEFMPVIELLLSEISKILPDLESKIWHGAPVWFSEGNPIVGYWVRKNYVQLLFWSGQSFDEPDLHVEGSFKAAEARYTSTEQINLDDLHRWLKKAQDIQWDYKNIVKNRGVLNRLK